MVSSGQTFLPFRSASSGKLNSNSKEDRKVCIAGDDQTKTLLFCSDRVSTVDHSLNQGSPTFLKARATSCVSINAKGY